MSLARDGERTVEHVDAEHGALGPHRGECAARFARAAAGVEHAHRAAQPVTFHERTFLRPDRLELRGERAHHGLVRHLLALRVQVGHVALVPRSTSARSAASVSSGVEGGIEQPGATIQRRPPVAASPRR